MVTIEQQIKAVDDQIKNLKRLNKNEEHDFSEKIVNLTAAKATLSTLASISKGIL